MKNHFERWCFLEFWSFSQDHLVFYDPCSRPYLFRDRSLYGSGHGLSYQSGHFPVDPDPYPSLHVLFREFFDPYLLYLALVAYHGPFGLCWKIKNFQ